MNARHLGRLTQCLGVTLLAAVALFGAPRLHASVVVPLSLAELTDAAAVIVDARVAEVRVAQGPDGAERMVLLHVLEAWKGPPEGALFVRLAGGRLGRVETRVSGVPDVTAGERLVWFLTPHPRGGYSVVGLHQGALRTVAAPSGEAHVVAPAGVSTRGDLRRAPRRLAALAADVRRLTARAAQQ